VTTPVDDDLIELFRERDGIPTRVDLEDGRRIRVTNIAWGYDDGDEWAHVTTNVSPLSLTEQIDVLSTNEVVTVTDPDSNAVLYSAEGR
jgi:hypothetical protein